MGDDADELSRVESPRSANRSNFIGTNALDSEAAAQLILPTITSESNFAGASEPVSTAATNIESTPTQTMEVQESASAVSGTNTPNTRSSFKQQRSRK